MHAYWALVIALTLTSCSSGSLPDQGVEAVVGPSLPVQSDSTASQITKNNWWHPLVAQLSHDADAIVVGKVLDQETEAVRVDWLPRKIILTHNTVQIESHWKGNSPKTVVVTTYGGCRDKVCMDTSHQASFEAGERSLIFLNQSGKNWIILRGEIGKICLDGRYLKPETGDVEITEGELQSVVTDALHGDHRS